MIYFCWWFIQNLYLLYILFSFPVWTVASGLETSACLSPGPWLLLVWHHSILTSASASRSVAHVPCLFWPWQKSQSNDLCNLMEQSNGCWEQHVICDRRPNLTLWICWLVFGCFFFSWGEVADFAFKCCFKKAPIQGALIIADYLSPVIFFGAIWFLRSEPKKKNLFQSWTHADLKRDVGLQYLIYCHSDYCTECSEIMCEMQFAALTLATNKLAVHSISFYCINFPGIWNIAVRVVGSTCCVITFENIYFSRNPVLAL